MSNNVSIWFKKPTVIFGLLCLVCTFWILHETGFHLPDFYTDRELANSIAHNFSIGSTAKDIDNAVSHLLNNKFDFQNNIFYLWSWLITLFLFVLIFRIKTFDVFKRLTILNERRFAYCWANISFIFFEICYIVTYMIDLNKYVYSRWGDSFGIPFFTQVVMQVLIALVFYPVLNFALFMTFNLKTKNIFYIFLWVIAFIYWALMLLGCSVLRVTFLHVYLNFHFLLWFVFIIYSIGYIKHQALVK